MKNKDDCQLFISEVIPEVQHFDTCGNKKSSSYDFSQPLFRYNYPFVLVPADLILSQNCCFHGREWHKVYKAADKKNIDDWIAMDAAAGQPCHDYQKTGPGIWYVSSLSVDPTMQGIGLGTQMIDYYENYIRERGGKQVVLFTNSQKNLNFYLKRGYELFDERVFEYNDHKMGSWSLKKVL